MSALDELIYDRTQTDVTYAAELNRKLGRGEALTAQELADWNAGLKGTYNASDMNRVDAAVRELGGLLTGAGYPVKYTSPIPQPEQPIEREEIVLTAADLQDGVYLYASGTLDNRADYICTKAKIPVMPGKCIAVRTALTLQSDCGFCWYDNDQNFISGTTGGIDTLWDGCFQEAPPENAAYCNININSNGILASNAGTIYVRQELDPENAPLPDGYSRVEYIESTGAEYIDTGYMPTQNTAVICKIGGLSTAQTAQAIFGARESNGTNSFNFLVTVEGTYRTDYGSSAVTIPNANFVNPYNVNKSKNNTTITDGINTYTATNTVTNFSSTRNLYIFACNTGGTATLLCTQAQLYNGTIYEDDILIRYYLSCMNSSGTVGLYDTVSGAFFANSASQTDGFTHGNIITPSPEPEPSNEWKIGDIINYDTWGIYLKNVQNIREAYYTMPDTPELPMPTAPLTFDGANAIEKILYDIQILYDAMSAMYRKCGTFQSGANVQQLPLQRSVT